jgi:hypothetical protein
MSLLLYKLGLGVNCHRVVNVGLFGLVGKVAPNILLYIPTPSYIVLPDATRFTLI